MSAQALEQTLRDVGSVGTLVKDRGYRQIRRFEHGGRAYYLKFYPKPDSAMGRLKAKVRGSPAMREFLRLQWLQKADVPAPRGVAVLMGFRLNDVIGDAVVLHAIEPNITLDRYFNDLHLRGERAADHYELSVKVRELVYALGKAKLGHSDLHLGNFLLREGKVYVLDGHAVRRGGLRQRDVMQLGHSAARYATTGDLARAWQRLGIGPMPDRNPLSGRIWRKFIRRAAHGGNRYFGRIESEGWSGVFFRQYKYPHRWSPASRLEFDEGDWRREWPDLLRRMEADGLVIKKRSRSGDVLAADVVLAGRPVSVILKRPKKRYWYRYLNEVGRGGRARRAWNKAWSLVVRNIPTAWPLLLMEKRRFGYVTDAVIVCELVPGKDLAVADLDAMEPEARDMLFRRAGRLLRRIEKLGFSHFDAKASNWIVYDDEKTGPQPILVDVDGVRRRRWIALGIQRLLRSMKEHGQYTPADSLALCQGYAPRARLVEEQ